MKFCFKVANAREDKTTAASICNKIFLMLEQLDYFHLLLPHEAICNASNGVCF